MKASDFKANRLPGKENQWTESKVRRLWQKREDAGRFPNTSHNWPVSSSLWTSEMLYLTSMVHFKYLNSLTTFQNQDVSLSNWDFHFSSNVRSVYSGPASWLAQLTKAPLVCPSLYHSLLPPTWSSSVIQTPCLTLCTFGCLADALGHGQVLLTPVLILFFSKMKKNIENICVVFRYKILLEECLLIFLKHLTGKGRKLLSQWPLVFRISLESYDLHVWILFLLFHPFFSFP